MIRSGNIEGSLDSWGESETPLPEAPPLRWTRNFVWVVLLCMLSLQIVPVLIAWIASVLLK